MLRATILLFCTFAITSFSQNVESIERMNEKIVLLRREIEWLSAQKDRLIEEDAQDRGINPKDNDAHATNFNEDFYTREMTFPSNIYKKNGLIEQIHTHENEIRDLESEVSKFSKT